jgi:hypothetical protein
MPKNNDEGDAEAYARVLENPELFFTDLQNQKAQSKPMIPRRRPRGYVGKGHPPVASRWQAGQSGNPSGRRKGQKNLTTIVREALRKKVTIREGDKVRRVIVLEAIIMGLVLQALKGDHKAIQATMTAAKTVDLGGEQKELMLGDLKLLSDDEVAELNRLIDKMLGSWKPVQVVG